MRRLIHLLRRASRISSLSSAREWKYSSTRPLANVPRTCGPMPYCDERVWRMWSSLRREMSEPDEGP